MRGPEDVPVLEFVVMAALAAGSLLAGLSWHRGWRWGRAARSNELWLRLYADGKSPVLFRNLPFTAIPLALSMASCLLAAALAALGRVGALVFFLVALALALGAVATWFAYSPPSWLIPRWLDETRRAMPPMRPHRWDRFMVVVLLVLTIPSALFVTAAGLYMLLAVGWFG